jgi:hypothetical protein
MQTQIALPDGVVSDPNLNGRVLQPCPFPNKGGNRHSLYVGNMFRAHETVRAHIERMLADFTVPILNNARVGIVSQSHHRRQRPLGHGLVILRACRGFEAGWSVGSRVLDSGSNA